MIASRLATAAFVTFAGALLVSLACGGDVDIGGNADAGLSLDCEPCTFEQDCHAGAICGSFSGDQYCATLCPAGNECAGGQTCGSVTSSSGTTSRACLPSSGACPAAESPPGPDGGVLEKCGSLNGPNVTSACHSCDPGLSCQPNGCYGGWWCNTTTSKCQRPPKC